MIRNDHSIDGLQRLQNFFAFFLRHKHVSFLFQKPVVVIENNHEFIAQCSCLLEQPSMTNMNWVKASAHGNNNSFFRLFLHRFFALPKTPFPKEVQVPRGIPLPQQTLSAILAESFHEKSRQGISPKRSQSKGYTQKKIGLAP